MSELAGRSYRERITIGPAVPVNAGSDVAATTISDFTTVQRFQSAKHYGWCSIEMDDGDAMVSIAYSSTAAATPDVFHQRVKEGTIRFFPLPNGCYPDVKITAVAGTGSTPGTALGRVFFHR